jgi:hypothetical protein
MHSRQFGGEAREYSEWKKHILMLQQNMADSEERPTAKTNLLNGMSASLKGDAATWYLTHKVEIDELVPVQAPGNGGVNQADLVADGQAERRQKKTVGMQYLLLNNVEEFWRQADRRFSEGSNGNVLYADLFELRYTVGEDIQGFFRKFSNLLELLPKEAAFEVFTSEYLRRLLPEMVQSHIVITETKDRTRHMVQTQATTAMALGSYRDWENQNRGTLVSPYAKDSKRIQSMTGGTANVVAAVVKPTGKCFYCGKPGHFQNACRKKKKDEAAAKAANSTGDTSSASK